MTSTNEKKRTPGVLHLNIFHYDPAPDGSGLEPMGMSYIFPFAGEAWGAVNNLCEIFDSLTLGSVYDSMFSTITPTKTPQEALYECSAAVKYSSPRIETIAVEYLLPTEKVSELTGLLPSWKQEIISTIWDSDLEVMRSIVPRLDEYFLGLM
jgi:hypothetical protein